MSILIEIDTEDECHPQRVMLDDLTVAWLVEIADSCHTTPAVIIASMLQDLREDDEAAHIDSPMPIKLN